MSETVYRDAIALLESLERGWFETERSTDTHEVEYRAIWWSTPMPTKCEECGTESSHLRNYDDGSMMGRRKWVDKYCWTRLSLDWLANEYEPLPDTAD